MDELSALVFVVIVTNAGGEGKTLLARLMKALWVLLGRTVEILDGDPGNFTARITELGVKVLGWGVGAYRARDIVAATRGHNVILDMGANGLASMSEIVDLLPALQKEYAAAGYRTVALLPVSTNKAGAVEAITELAGKIDDFEKLYVTVNRDGSNTFEKGLEGREVVHVEHLAPGFQNYLNGPGKSLVQSVTEPPSGFKVAAAFVADWMRKFAVQSGVQKIVGDVLPILDRHAPDAPPSIRFTVPTLAQATDEALDRNAYKSRIMDAIDEDGWTEDGLIAVAHKLGSGRI